jgi:hypothetical protein
MNIISRYRSAICYVIASATVLLLPSCKHAAKYPGYSYISSSPGYSYYIKPDSVTTTVASGTVSFSLLAEQSDGTYSIGVVETSCHGKLIRADAVAYAKGGKMLRIVPGDQSPLMLSSAPQLSQVLKSACASAASMRSFAGSFDRRRAMTLLFGNYDPGKGTAEVQGLVALDPSFETDTGSAAIFLDAPFQEAGVERRLLLTYTVPEGQDYSCHACPPLISGFLFAHKDDKWFVDISEQRIGVSSSWGKPPMATLVQVGPDRHAIVFSDSDMAQGYSSSTDSIWVPVDAVFQQAINITTESDDDGGCEMAGTGCYQYRTTYSFGPGRNRDWFDLRVSVTGTEPIGDTVVPVSTVTNYVFDKGKYNATSPPQDTSGIESLLHAWVDTWKREDLEGHMQCYGPVLEVYFRKHNISSNEVREDKARAFRQFTEMRVYEIDDLQVSFDTATSATAVFVKKWDAIGSSEFSGEAQERLKLTQLNQQWLITSEEETKVLWVKKGSS